jgi:hypothetical protein
MRHLLLGSFLVIFPCSVYAQLSSSSVEVVSGAVATPSTDPAPNTPQWQVNLDVIKHKAQVLIKQNAKLTDEYNTLVAGIQRAQIDQRDLKIKNESLRQLIKQRRGKSQEQIEIEKHNDYIKAKESNIRALQNTIKNTQKDLAQQERKTELRKLKLSEVELHVKREATQSKAINLIDERVKIENDEEHNKLKEMLAHERDEERILKQELEKAKNASINPPQAPAIDDAQLKALQDKVDQLAKQKEDLQNRLNKDNNQTNARYLQLTAKKKELEERIKVFETQLNQLKEPATFGLLDPKQKKQIVRQMVQVNNRNAQLRQKISDLKEDVVLLREQVNRLERRTKGAQKE